MRTYSHCGGLTQVVEINLVSFGPGIHGNKSNVFQ